MLTTAVQSPLQSGDQKSHEIKYVYRLLWLLLHVAHVGIYVRKPAKCSAGSGAYWQSYMMQITKDVATFFLPLWESSTFLKAIKTARLCGSGYLPPLRFAGAENI